MKRRLIVPIVLTMLLFAVAPAASGQTSTDPVAPITVVITAEVTADGYWECYGDCGGIPTDGPFTVSFTYDAAETPDATYSDPNYDNAAWYSQPESIDVPWAEVPLVTLIHGMRLSNTFGVSPSRYLGVSSFRVKADYSSGAQVSLVLGAPGQWLDYDKLPVAVDLTDYDECVDDGFVTPDPATTGFHHFFVNSWGPGSLGSGFACISDMVWGSPEDLIVYLAGEVADLGLPAGIANSLTVKLDNALTVLTDTDPANDYTALEKLQSFIDQLNALSGKKINATDADKLIATAQAIIDMLTG